MPFPTPRLDDRTFDDLMREAKEIIRARSPEWTDFSPSDPGMVLVELFAFLTENMLYRLNRVPEKVHIALLNLLGVAMQPPAAAIVTLTFSRTGQTADKAIIVPAGARVSDAGGVVTFETLSEARIQPGAGAVEVAAIHADSVEAELLGVGSGEPGQSFQLRRAPLIRSLPDIATLTIGVEEDASRLEPNMTVRQYDGKAFVMWKETPSFQGLHENERAYALNPATGAITFSPLAGAGSATLGQVPPKGAAVRAWYRIGGGKAGNVLAGALVAMREPLSGVAVVNAGRATGGEDGETLERAMLRGREAVQSITSAVTARDFERLALSAGGVARARTYAQRDLWTFGEPGVVEVRIVPALEAGEAATLETMRARQTSHLHGRVDALLAERRPIGVRTKVLWAHCRAVAVSARVVISSVEDPDVIGDRIRRRLDDLISPTGRWPFGKTLRASDVYDAILTEPGVRYAEQLSFAIEEGPKADVVDLHRDPNQPRAFYAVAGGRLYRTLDNAESWTTILAQDGSDAIALRSDAEQPGLLMALLTEKGSDAMTVQLSRDGGESWSAVETIQSERLYDVASLKNGPRTQLYYAGRKGLRVVSLGDAASSTLLDRLGPDASENHNDGGLYAVAVARLASGVPCVAVARREKRGVLISREGGKAGSFQTITGAEGRDVRRLYFMREGDRMFLWAILAAERGEAGEGVMRVEARGDGVDPEGWKIIGEDWRGGSCTGLSFSPGLVAASSNRAGVCLLDAGKLNEPWSASALASGLPIEEDRKTLAALTGVGLGLSTTLILASGASGVFGSRDEGQRYVAVGDVEFSDRAPLPPNSLYCSGSHDIRVVRENAVEG
ncbi:MAG: baseplate J/gp47 family protein [Beijerinckiaceae bacterium]|nr:baseplate J/gp47 family protein [Beijerinckiaceae bacterium]